MHARPLQLGAIVLAAGAGRRFSSRPGAKLLALIDGEPMLGRILRIVRAYGPPRTVVVLGFGAGRIDSAIDWSGEQRVVNPMPQRGLSSSLQLGVATLSSQPNELDGAFIVLGDQPQLRVEVMRALAGAAQGALRGDRVFVVPRYEANPGPRNPVLLLRPAWALMAELAGDEGLGALIEARPDMVLDVPVSGRMPDIDTPSDLEAAGRQA